MLKSNKYALSDGEDDIFTHHGAALSTLDDFEDEIVEDDDDGTAISSWCSCGRELATAAQIGTATTSLGAVSFPRYNDCLSRVLLLW